MQSDVDARLTEAAAAGRAQAEARQATAAAAAAATTVAACVCPCLLAASGGGGNTGTGRTRSPQNSAASAERCSASKPPWTTCLSVDGVQRESDAEHLLFADAGELFGRPGFASTSLQSVSPPLPEAANRDGETAAAAVE